jgi:hypothetical protein
MKGNRAAMTAVVVLVLIAGGWWLFGRRTAVGSVDLLETFPQARKQPGDSVFQVVEATLNGETKRAIASEGATRLTWRVTIPDDAWLRVDVGMKPEAWEKENEGAYFFVVVSDDRNSDQLFSQHVHPFANQADRKWMPAFIDLSAYAGEEVNVILNVRAGVGGRSGNYTNILALWGEPAIVVR